MHNKKFSVKIVNGEFCVIIKASGKIVKKFDSYLDALDYIDKN